MTVVELPRPGHPARARLFPDQAEAIQRLARHLRRAGTRGLFVSATGTGKTLVSIRTADELGARLVLFVVPTLDLAAQTALAWRGDGHLEHMVIVFSLDTRGRDDLVAARIMSATDPHALGGLMSVVREGEDRIPALTVICTYDSLDKIEETRNTGYAVPPFDLAVMDEAHWIAGRADKKWAVVNDAQRIRADRRLYMKAPHIFAAPEFAESADTTRSRRLGLTVAQSYHDELGHLDVPADYTDPTGYRLGTFITTMRDARTAGRLEADWTTELDALGMIWDKHTAAWRSRLAAAADYHRTHGPLAAPATSPPRTPSTRP